MPRLGPASALAYIGTAIAVGALVAALSEAVTGVAVGGAVLACLAAGARRYVQ